MIIVLGHEEFGRLERALESLVRAQRETNELLRIIAGEVAPPIQLASTGATVKVVSS